ncbi:MAG: GNAT family N-acetyltransferase [Alphaproteobacteria bacterium]
MGIVIERALHIRGPVADDYPAWRRLWEQYLTSLDADVPESVTDATWARILDHRPEVFARLAERAGRVVGFAVCILHPGTWTTAPICYLEDLCVDAAHRGGGIGHALIEDLLSLAKANGWARLYWHTGTGNAAARRLYDRFVAADDLVRYRIFID